MVTFEVMLEMDGGPAARQIVREQPNIVILDTLLPGQDGFEICRQICPRYTGPVMILTAHVF